MKKLEVLGPGCAKCVKLAELTAKAATDLGLDCEVVKVTDLGQILSHRVMMTPALVVDGVVKCSGRVPGIDELKTMIA
jgi:small redox-active disulfide protein 2